MPTIPYGRQDITQADIDAVVKVLRSDWLTQGPAVDAFERAIADYVGAGHGVAVCNATAALHLACRALGLGPGDWLWTSPNTFVASANAALYCGAKVDFVDIDDQTYNMSISSLEEKLIAAAKAGKLPKIVIPVHFSGQPCDMAAIAALAAKYGFRVVEDASHAIGGEYQAAKIGNCRFSDITVFSFHPVKIITTGEGGIAVTNDPELYRKLSLLRTHGITRDPQQLTASSEGAWYYEQLELGMNYRMTDIQAALGASQLHRVDKFVLRRRQIAEAYDKHLANLPVVLPFQASFGRSAWHLYVIQIREATRRGEIFSGLREAGVLVNVHYIPVHLQPYYRRMGFGPGQFPIAEGYYKRAITLPVFFGLTEDCQQCVISQLKRLLA